MEIFLTILFLIIGFALLVKGADFFVDGACGLSLRLKIPAYLIGITVVAFGTSLPEAAVSITASIQGNNAIALGNIVGSNIFNTLMVLGISALFTSLPVGRVTLRRDFPFCLGISALLFLLLLIPSPTAPVLGHLDGALLLLCFVIFMILSIKQSKKEALSVTPEKNENTSGDPTDSQKDKPSPLWKCLLLILLGIAGVIGGGQLTVETATRLAEIIGLSDSIIGLTVVAIGTSLPELVTSIVAARKKQVDIAVGNAVGSNIFNILFILGASSAISPISAVGNAFALVDAGILFGITLLTLLFILPKKKLSLPAGIPMVLVYIGYTAFLLLREGAI